MPLKLQQGAKDVRNHLMKIRGIQRRAKSPRTDGYILKQDK